MNIYSWLHVNDNLFALAYRITATTAAYEHRTLGVMVFTYQEDQTIVSDTGEVATPVTNESQDMLPELAGFPAAIVLAGQELVRIDTLIAKNQMRVWPYRKSDGTGGVLYVYHIGGAFDVFESLPGGALSWLGQAEAT